MKNINNNAVDEVPKILKNVKVVGTLADYVRLALVELANQDDRKGIETDNSIIITVAEDKKINPREYVEIASQATHAATDYFVYYDRRGQESLVMAETIQYLETRGIQVMDSVSAIYTHIRETTFRERRHEPTHLD